MIALTIERPIPLPPSSLLRASSALKNLFQIRGKFSSEILSPVLNTVTLILFFSGIALLVIFI